jgi:hypothetical protein
MTVNNDSQNERHLTDQYYVLSYIINKGLLFQEENSVKNNGQNERHSKKEGGGENILDIIVK